MRNLITKRPWECTESSVMKNFVPLRCNILPTNVKHIPLMGKDNFNLFFLSFSSLSPLQTGRAGPSNALSQTSETLLKDSKSIWKTLHCRVISFSDLANRSWNGGPRCHWRSRGHYFSLFHLRGVKWQIYFHGPTLIFVWWWLMRDMLKNFVYKQDQNPEEDQFAKLSLK